MKRLALLALLLAACVPPEPQVRPSRPAPRVPAPIPEPIDHYRLGTLGKVLYYVDEQYFAPKQVDPERILRASLEALEAEIDELQVVTSSAGGIALRTRNAEKRISTNVRDLDEARTRLQDAFAFLKSEVGKHHSGQRLEYAVIAAALGTLDAQTTLLTPDVYDEMKLSSAADFGGLGIVMARREGALTVIAPLEGTPSFRAGVRPGDKIVSIEGIPSSGMPLEEAVQLLRGPVGTVVSITLSRSGAAAPIRISAPREKIAIRNVTGGLLDRIAYVRVKGMQQETSIDVRTMLAGFEKKLGTTLDGIILDLRGCPGGLLDEAIRTAELFVDRGKILDIATRVETKSFTSKGIGDRKTPLAVLVDESTAAGAEIIAAAIIDRERGIVIGGRTYGQGTIQNLFDLRDGSALKLTIAEDLRPSGETFTRTGVMPDLEVTPLQITSETVRILPNRSSPSTDPARPEHRLEVLDALQPVAPLDSSDRSQDPAVRLSVALLRNTPGGTRARLLANLPEVIRSIQPIEEPRIVSAMHALGVDWSAVPQSGNHKITANVTSSGPASPGSTLDLRIAVKNEGRTEIGRVHLFLGDATLENATRVQAAVGRLAAGATKTVSVKWPIAVDAPEGASVIVVTAHSDRGPILSTARHTVIVKDAPVATLSSAWEIFDPSPGNEDGTLQANESAELLFRMRNEGSETISQPVISVSALDPEFVKLERRFAGGDPLPPKSTLLGRFRVRAGAPPTPSLGFRVRFGDGARGLFNDSVVRVPLVPPGGPVTGSSQLAAAPSLRATIVGGPSVAKPSTRIDVEASGDSAIDDVWITVNGDKLLYRDLDDGLTGPAKITLDAPLVPGTNFVDVVARGVDGARSTKRMSILRTE